MSRWSMRAISPRCSDLTSTFVRRPERTGPLTVRAGARSAPRSRAARGSGLRLCPEAVPGPARTAA